MPWYSAILELDRTVFHWINSGCSNAFFDAVLPFFREKWFWAPFYLFVVGASWVNFGKSARWVLLGIILTVGVADFTSSTLIKKNVQRLRPCNDPALADSMVYRVPCGGGYSFTSSHAANHFAIAFFLIGVFGGLSKWVKPVLILWAGTISLAQVYVGVHYPVDVTVGALIGSFIGWGIFRLGRKFQLLPTDYAR